MPRSRWSIPAALILIFACLPLFAAVPTPPVVLETPPEPVLPDVQIEAITLPATVPPTTRAERLEPMIQEIPVVTAPPCNTAGLNCLPFYTGDPADLCAEMNFYRMQNPIRKCCGGYYQIGWANITAPGYAAAGVWSNCGITRAQDYVGASPLAKQKSVCAAAGLYHYHLVNGPYAMHPWDSYL